MNGFALVAALTTAFVSVSAQFFGWWQRRGVVNSESSKNTSEAEKNSATAGQTIGDTYEKLLDRLEKTVKQQGEEIHLLREQVQLLVEHNQKLQNLELRFEDVPGLLPMGQFVEDGWLTELNNKVANPEDLHVMIYTDNLDGRVALGYDVVRRGQVPPGALPVEGVDERRRRFRQIVEEFDS